MGEFHLPAARGRLGIILIAAAAVAGSGRASIAYSNFSNGQNATGPFVSVSTWDAFEFETGSTSDTFTDVSGYFENTSASVNSSIDGGIYSDSSGAPGTLLQAFTSQTINANTTTPTEFTFLPAASFQFSASTVYWIVFHDAGGGVFWQYDASETVAPTTFDGYTVGAGFSQSVNTGSTWSSYDMFPSIQMDVTLGASGTPEPGTFALTIAGAALIALRIARRA